MIRLPDAQALLASLAIATGCIATPALATSDRETLQAGTPEIVIEVHQTEGGQYAVPTSVEGHQPLDFVIDTGANRTAILMPLALKLGLLSQEEHDLMIHGLNSAFVSRELEVRELEFGSGQIGPLQTALLPLTNDGYITAYGLLGADAFESQVIALDLDDLELRIGVDAPDARRDRNMFEIDDFGLLRARADIAGVDAIVIIDSGSTRTFANNALLHAVNARRTSARITFSGVNPDAVDRVAGSFVDWVRVGSLCRRNFHVVRSDLHIFETLEIADQPAMIIGLDFLQGMTLTIDRESGVFALDGPFGGSCRAARIGR